ncbi:hypothetical protein [Spongiimicrobium salis]|uniref:hypothetical protein n=1 Tax=Spongiimicrobium salis TaxID=1667022 RepID=UPI00374D80ED
MIKKIKIALLLVGLSPLLLAILCEEEDLGLEIGPRNKTAVTLSAGPIFSVNDTLWINGKVSSMIATGTPGDSIANENAFIRDIISVMRLKTADRNSNTREAVDEFQWVTRIGSIDFLGACPDSELIAQGPLTENGQEYEYEIGLVPVNRGDFVLSWLEPVAIRNTNLNTELLEQYQLEDNPNALGLTKCGITSTIPSVQQSKGEFFFSVD